jgi:tetratricopeptide (TPR) repeat protein
MPYDIFISYSRLDNQNQRVTELKERIEADYRTFTGEELHCFYDIEKIHGMDDWRHRILSGLRESNLLLLVLSPAYLASKYCEWEINEYLKYEYSRAAAGQGVAPIYFVEVPGLDTPGFEQKAAAWVARVRRRNHFDLRPWQDEGATALRRQDVRNRLDDLERTLQARISKLRRLAAAPGNLPSHNPHFVGRETEMQRLHESAGLGRFGVLTALQGMGGLGKTAIAIQYAYAYADFYPGGRWHIGCTCEKSLASVIRKLDVDLCISFSEEEKRDDDRAARRILAELESRTWNAAGARSGEKDPPAPRALLLLDNVDFPDLLRPPQSDLVTGRHWLHVIATTRLGGDDFGHDPERQTLLAIDELPSEDAVRLIESHQPQGRFTGSEEEAAACDIVNLLGGFTLAVEVAAIYLGERYGQVTCKAFLERLRTGGLAGLEEVARSTKRALHHRQKLVGATLAPTLDLLAPEEIFILSCAACLPPDRIPIPWLRALAVEVYPQLGEDAPVCFEDPWMSHINHLLGTRLLQVVEIDQKQGLILIGKMHRLVQQAILLQTGFENSGVVSFVRSRAMIVSLPGSWGGSQTHWEALAVTAAAHLWLDRPDGAGVEIGAAVSRALLGLECVQAAEQIIETVAIHCRKIFGPDHPLTATCLDSYSDLLREMGRFDEAERAVMEAIAIDRVKSAASPWLLARDYNYLGLLQHVRGSLAEAETSYLNGLRIMEEVPENNSEAALQKALLRHDLADLYREQGRLDQSIKGLQESIPAFEALLGKQHLYVATVYNNLAVAYHQVKLFDDAEQAYRKSLDIYITTLGNNHLRVANSLHHLSILLMDTRRSREAVPLLRRAIGIMKGLHRLPGRDDKLLKRMTADFTTASIWSGSTRSQLLNDEVIVGSGGVGLTVVEYAYAALRAGQYGAALKGLFE